ncbi:MAG: hypothetical protein AAFQ65_05790 [Myxococcota bacterium]
MAHPLILRGSRSIQPEVDDTSGNTYAEYQEGDELAEYGLMGLMGLMVGRGAVLAFPRLRKLWFPIVAAVVGVGQFFGKLLFGEKISKSENRS